LAEKVEVKQPVDEKKGFENFLRFGDTSMILNSVTTGTSSAGYLVPEELRKQIVSIMYETGAMMNLADVIHSTTLMDIPVDATAPTAYWIAEEGAFTESSPTVGRIQLGANKIGCLVKVSEELLADSAFNVESYISNLAGTAFGRAGENEFINGTVSGRPTGFLELLPRRLLRA
jgi:HK97 family phage major capsid protein